MSDPTQGTATPMPLSLYDRVRVLVAPTLAYGTLILWGWAGTRYGVPVPSAVAQLSDVLGVYLVARWGELLIASHTNPGGAASPRVAKNMKASASGSASEGAANLSALAATGERPTAGRAAAAQADTSAMFAAADAASFTHPGPNPHGVADAGTHADDGEAL